MGIKEQAIRYARGAREAAGVKARNAITRGKELARDPNVRRTTSVIAAEIVVASANRLAQTPSLPEGSTRRDKVQRVIRATIDAAGDVFDARVDAYLSNLQQSSSSR